MTAETVGLLVLYLIVYFLPWMVARGRVHRQRNAIAVLNLFLGWTVLGWIAALVWACTAHRDHQASAAAH